jgi:hypothetical protein
VTYRAYQLVQERSGDISENITRGVSAIREYDAR